MSTDYSQPIRLTDNAGIRSIVVPGSPVVTHCADLQGQLSSHHASLGSAALTTRTPLSRDDFEALWLTCRNR